MGILQLLAVLNARKKIIFTVLLMLFSLVLLYSLISPKTYTATTSVLLNYKGVDPVTGVMLPAQLMPGYMATQVDIIRSENVALRVVRQLGLAKGTEAIEKFNSATDGKGDIDNWYAALLLKALEVKPSRESSVLEISFTGSNPNFAALMANAFAEQYIQTNVELKVAPAKKASDYFKTQSEALRDNLASAQKRLSDFLESKGITNENEQYDVESLRLNELTQQLMLARGQSIDASSRYSGALGNQAVSPDVIQNGVIQNLKVDVVRTESKLSELGGRLGVNHPQYQAAQAELDKLRSQLVAETARISQSLGKGSSISQSREKELEQAVEQQKMVVLGLKKNRDQIEVLKQDVVNAQKALDTAAVRFTQTNIEGDSKESDVAILNPAVAPMKPSGPRVLLNSALALFVGSILGVVLALLLEGLNRKIRQPQDIVDMLDVPVYQIRPVKKARPKLLAVKNKLKFLN